MGRLLEDLNIERAHRVGQKRQFFTRTDGSRVKANPRPIVAKFKDWKQKEKVTNAAKKLRPDGVKFLDEFSKRTLNKRFAQQPVLLNARKEGKIAYFAVNRPIIRDKPPENNMHKERQSTEQHTSDEEVSFNRDL